MTRHIDENEVVRIAQLARLKLDHKEVVDMTLNLEKILTYFKKLDELDTNGIEETLHPVELPTHMRRDDIGAELPVEKALANAPERLGDGFGVPKIIE